MVSSFLITYYYHLLLLILNIDHGYLRGNKKISFTNKTNVDENGETKSSEKRTLMDLIIETVAKCSEEYDDGVHIQVHF